MSTVRPDMPGLPETVPARMVNEFVYCPRLFYLEWVQGRFATSDDVEEGLYVHRVVDEPSADLPDPTDDLERFAGRTSRSFWLTSTAIGVSARIDIVEVDDDGAVVPVDYKKGHPDPRGRIWPSDEIQSVIQALLLQDAGYTVHRAEDLVRPDPAASRSAHRCKPPGPGSRHPDQAVAGGHRRPRPRTVGEQPEMRRLRPGRTLPAGRDQRVDDPDAVVDLG